MPDDVTFLDLACLMKISSDITLEKFGSAINSSIFDASNIAGSLKQKDMIDFTSIFPGPNSIAVTEKGKAVLSEAEQKSLGQFDSLDRNILSQLSKGKRSPEEIQNAISLNSKDLAMRIYKLSKQQLLTYEVKSGHVDILLTEQGFLMAAPQMQQATQQPKPAQPTAQPVPKPAVQQADPAQMKAVQNAGPAQSTPSAETTQPVQKSGRRRRAAAVIIVVVIVIIVIYFLTFYKK